MNANELYINKFYLINGDVCKFEDRHWYNIGECILFIEDIEPIQVTEEWLLKFGFKHIKDNWYNIFSNENTFNVYLFTDKRFRIEIVNQSICVLNHVHQLQNLYFALTNKELKINI